MACRTTFIRRTASVVDFGCSYRTFGRARCSDREWDRVRTQTEIVKERYALKALRGDFKGVPAAVVEKSDQALRAASR